MEIYEVPEEALDAADEVLWQMTTHGSPRSLALMVLKEAGPIIARKAWAEGQSAGRHNAFSEYTKSNPYKESK